MIGLPSDVVATVSILGLATFLAIYFRKRLLETVFLSSGLIILILFTFGLLGFRGSLLIGYWVVIGLSIAATAYSIRAMYIRRALIGEVGLWHGLTVIGIFSAFSLFLNYNRWFVSWDEFSHWGIVVKHMYSQHALGSIPGSGLMLPDYFPGISLFGYFFSSSNSTFVEYPVFMASNFLFFSMVATLIKKIDVKSVLLTVAFTLGPLVIGLASSTTFFSNMQVDMLMGCLFGFSVIVYLRYWRNGKDIFAVILFSTALAILTISKDMGIVLALLVTAVCALDMVLYRRKDIARLLVGRDKRKMIYRLIPLLLPLSTVFIPWLLYKLNLKLSGVQSSWQDVSIGNLFTGNLKDYQVNVINDFWRNFFSAPEPPIPISFFWSMVVLLGILILWSIFIKNREVAKRIITIGTALFLGSFIYGVLIMSLYVIIFSEYEAVRLASYERYMGTYLVGYSVFVAGTFIFKTRFLGGFYKKYRSTITLILFLGAMALGYAICRSTSEGRILYDVFHARQEVATTINTRAPYEVAKQWRPCLNNQNDKLNIIATNTRGNERNILLYTLYPIAAQTDYRSDYSVGEKPYSTEDIWTLVASPDGWRAYVIKNYTLIYVFKYDDAFEQSYGHYFDDLRSDQLYKVVVSGDKSELKSVRSDDCIVNG